MVKDVFDKATRDFFESSFECSVTKRRRKDAALYAGVLNLLKMKPLDSVAQPLEVDDEEVCF